MDYKITKEQCLTTIKGVCSGCGGTLEPIETVDNFDNPTFWAGCDSCQKFDTGTNPIYFEIARNMVNSDLLPYSHLARVDYEDTPERLEYFLTAQTSGLVRYIKTICEQYEARKSK